MRTFLLKRECFSLEDLAINGTDLMKLGIPTGKEIGNSLQFLLNAVIDGEVQNKKENLINFLIEKKLK